MSHASNSSLASQLRSLAHSSSRAASAALAASALAPGADALRQLRRSTLRGRASFLFTAEDAVHSPSDLLQLGVKGLLTLQQLDARFSPTPPILSPAALAHLDRGSLTPEALAAQSAQVSRLVRLLAPYFLLPAAQQVLEALIGLYDVHIYHAGELLRNLLVFHDTSLFARLLQIIDITRDQGLWLFLATAQNNASPVARATLVQRALSEVAFLRMLCDHVLAVCGDVDTLGPVQRASAAKLFSSVCLHAILGAQFIKEPVVRALSSALFKALHPEHDCQPLRLAAYTILAELAARVKFSPKLLSSFVGHLLRGIPATASPAAFEKTLLCLAQVLQAQPPLQRFPSKAAAALLGFPVQAFLAPALARLAAHRVPVAALLDALLNLVADGRADDPSDLLRAVVANAPAATVRPHLPRIVELLLSKDSPLAASSDLPALLQLLEATFPSQIDGILTTTLASIASATSSASKAAQQHATALLQRAFSTSGRQLLSASGTTLFLALQHPMLSTRLLALEKLFELHRDNTMDAAEFVKLASARFADTHSDLLERLLEHFANDAARDAFPAHRLAALLHDVVTRDDVSDRVRTLGWDLLMRCVQPDDPRLEAIVGDALAGLRWTSGTPLAFRRTILSERPNEPDHSSLMGLVRALHIPMGDPALRSSTAYHTALSAQAAEWLTPEHLDALLTAVSYLIRQRGSHQALLAAHILASACAANPALLTADLLDWLNEHYSAPAPGSPAHAPLPPPLFSRHATAATDMRLQLYLESAYVSLVQSPVPGLAARLFDRFARVPFRFGTHFGELIEAATEGGAQQQLAFLAPFLTAEPSDDLAALYAALHLTRVVLASADSVEGAVAPLFVAVMHVDKQARTLALQALGALLEVASGSTLADALAALTQRSAEIEADPSFVSTLLADHPALATSLATAAANDGMSSYAVLALVRAVRAVPCSAAPAAFAKALQSITLAAAQRSDDSSGHSAHTLSFLLLRLDEGAAFLDASGIDMLVQLLEGGAELPTSINESEPAMSVAHAAAGSFPCAFFASLKSARDQARLLLALLRVQAMHADSHNAALVARPLSQLAFSSALLDHFAELLLGAKPSKSPRRRRSRRSSKNNDGALPDVAKLDLLCALEEALLLNRRATASLSHDVVRFAFLVLEQDPNRYSVQLALSLLERVIELLPELPADHVATLSSNLPLLTRLLERPSSAESPIHAVGLRVLERIAAASPDVALKHIAPVVASLCAPEPALTTFSSAADTETLCSVLSRTLPHLQPAGGENFAEIINLVVSTAAQLNHDAARAVLSALLAGAGAARSADVYAVLMAYATQQDASAEAGSLAAQQAQREVEKREQKQVRHQMRKDAALFVSALPERPDAVNLMLVASQLCDDTMDVRGQLLTFAGLLRTVAVHRGLVAADSGAASSKNKKKRKRASGSAAGSGSPAAVLRQDVFTTPDWDVSAVQFIAARLLAPKFVRDVLSSRVVNGKDEDCEQLYDREMMELFQCVLPTLQACASDVSPAAVLRAAAAASTDDAEPERVPALAALAVACDSIVQNLMNVLSLPSFVVIVMQLVSESSITLRTRALALLQAKIADRVEGGRGRNISVSGSRALLRVLPTLVSLASGELVAPGTSSRKKKAKRAAASSAVDDDTRVARHKLQSLALLSVDALAVCLADRHAAAFLPALECVMNVVEAQVAALQRFIGGEAHGAVLSSRVCCSSLACLSTLVEHMSVEILQYLPRFMPLVLQTNSSSLDHLHKARSAPAADAEMADADSDVDPEDDVSGTVTVGQMERIQLSALTVLRASLLSLTQFVHPYLSDMIGGLLHPALQVSVANDPHVAGQVVMSLVAALAPAKSSHKKKRKKKRKDQHRIEPRIVFPAIFRCFKTALDHGPGSLRFLYKLLARVCTNLSHAETLEHYQSVFAFILSGLSVRWRFASMLLRNVEPTDAVIALDQVEDDVVDAFMTLVLKLREKHLRVLFLKLVEWVGVSGGVSAKLQSGADDVKGMRAVLARCLPFYKTMNRLFESLETIFVPQFAFMVEDCVAVLELAASLVAPEEEEEEESSSEEEDEEEEEDDGDESMSDAQPSSRKRGRSSAAGASATSKRQKAHVQQRQASSQFESATMRLYASRAVELVLGSISLCFKHDEDGVYGKDTFDRLLLPVTSMLGHGIELFADGDETLQHSSYEAFLSESLAPCVVEMAVRMNNFTLWKPLNHHVLRHSHHESPRVRMAALDVVFALFERLEHNWLTMLPETMPFIAELMEDPDMHVEARCQQVIRRIEELSGEPLSQYLE